MRPFLSILFTFLFASATTFAQTIIFEEDFEDFTAGDYISTSPNWHAWSGETGNIDDAIISNEQNHTPDGSLSMKIAESNDIVYYFGNKTSGQYEISFNYYIPSGQGAYFNIQHEFGSNWAFSVQFQNDGAGSLYVDNTEINFTYTQDTWIEVKMLINLDDDEITLNIEDNLVHTWTFSLSEGNTTSNITLDCINFYGYDAVNPLYYVDDFKYIDTKPYTVTFNVDMTYAIQTGEFVADTDSVYLFGSFNSWAAPGSDSSMLMTDNDGDNIYTVEMELTGDSYEYKYFKNAGWNNGEWSGGNNRSFSVTDENLVLNDVWANKYLVTFNITDGTNPLPGVEINIAQQILTTDATGIATIELEPGVYDWTATLPGYNQETETLTLLGSGALQTVNVTMQNVITYTVTFNADMTYAIQTGEFIPGTDNIYLSGSFNSWAEPGSDANMLMTDADGDGTYTKEIELTNGLYEYKYFKNAGWNNGEWSGGNNRSFSVTDENLVLNDAWANKYLVTFNITDGTNPLSGVEINIAQQILTTNATGIATIELEPGVYDWMATLPGYNQETETLTLLGSGALQTVNVTMQNVITYTVTFNVTKGTASLEGVNIAINAENLITDADGLASIELENGNYLWTATIDGYNEVTGIVTVEGAEQTININMELTTYLLIFNITDGTSPLPGVEINIAQQILTTDASGSATIELDPGIYDWTATLPGYDNATGTVTVDDDKTVNIKMTANVGVKDLNTNVSIYPNPSKGKLTIKTKDNYHLEVMDIMGKSVYAKELTGSQNNIDLSNQAAGIYLIRLTNGNKIINHKIIIE